MHQLAFQHRLPREASEVEEHVLVLLDLVAAFRGLDLPLCQALGDRVARFQVGAVAISEHDLGVLLRHTDLAIGILRLRHQGYTLEIVVTNVLVTDLELALVERDHGEHPVAHFQAFLTVADQLVDHVLEEVLGCPRLTRDGHGSRLIAHYDLLGNGFDGFRFGRSLLGTRVVDDFARSSGTGRLYFFFDHDFCLRGSLSHGVFTHDFCGGRRFSGCGHFFCRLFNVLDGGGVVLHFCGGVVSTALDFQYHFGISSNS